MVVFLFVQPSAFQNPPGGDGGYTFRDGVWRGYGKGFRISGGIGNLFDEEPPFSDTVFGYNGGLHSQLVMGRSYEMSFTLPF